MEPLFPSPYFRGLILVTALGFMALEYGLGRLVHRETHDWRESAATLGVAVVQNLVRLVEAGIVAIPFAFVYQHRLFDFSATSAPAMLGLFLGSEFLYYWQHRASHRIRWMWATHRVHHSPTKFNLTAAIRLGWTGNISGNFLFFLPLVWIGFHPFAVIAMLGINLTYQFFIHTELAPRLGPLEYRAQHAGASSRASRVERALPRQELRRHPDRIRSPVRHVRTCAGDEAAALRTGRRQAILQPDTHRARRMDRDAPRRPKGRGRAGKVSRAVRTTRHLSRR